jgi:hypothetical protein
MADGLQKPGLTIADFFDAKHILISALIPLFDDCRFGFIEHDRYAAADVPLVDAYPILHLLQDHHDSYHKYLRNPDENRDMHQVMYVLEVPLFRLLEDLDRALLASQDEDSPLSQLERLCDSAYRDGCQVLRIRGLFGEKYRFRDVAESPLIDEMSRRQSLRKRQDMPGRYDLGEDNEYEID